jgi:hypothetical protein
VAQGYFIARPMPPADIPDWVVGFVAPAQWRLMDETARDRDWLRTCCQCKAR